MTTPSTSPTRGREGEGGREGGRGGEGEGGREGRGGEREREERGRDRHITLLRCSNSIVPKPNVIFFT